MKRAPSPAAFVLLAFVMTFSLLSCGGGDEGGTPEVVRYVVTDLQGTWYLGRVNTNDTGAAGNSYYGQLDLTSAGYVLPSSYYYLWANSYLSFEGGSLSLAQDTGVLSGTIITNTGSFKLDSGKMDPSKSAMVFTNYNSLLPNQFDLTIAIKRGGSYAGSDVEGTWYLLGLCSNPPGIGIIRGDMVVDKSGGITGNYILGGPAGARAYTIDSGTLSIFLDTPVTLLGNFVTNDATGRIIKNGMMDISKTFASVVIVSPEDPTISESEMVVMIKQASNLLNADLAGTWYISGASAGNAVPANDGTISGNLTLNAAGAITGGSITLPGLTALSITGGSMTVTTAGALEGTITTVDGNIYFKNGRLDASKNKMAFTDTTEKRLFILFSVK